MSNPRKPAPPAIPSFVTPDEERLPIATCLGLVHIPGKGWVPMYLETQGDRVVARELLGEPGSHLQAIHKLQIELVTRFQILKQKARA